MYEGKCRIINNRVDEDLCMQKSMKLRCRIKFTEPKVLLDKLKEISVKILTKNKAQQLLQNIANLNESKLL